MDKDWVTRHSGTILHSVSRHSFYFELWPLGTGTHGHWGARHSVLPSFDKNPLVYEHTVMSIFGRTPTLLRRKKGRLKPLHILFTLHYLSI